MTASNHTKEPWIGIDPKTNKFRSTPWAADNENASSTMSAPIKSGRQTVALVVTDDWSRKDELLANARRIVACVNACAGIGTEFLEVVPLGMFKQILDNSNYMEIKQNRDDLVVEVESLKERLKLSWENEPDWIEELRQHARGTLGKACEQRDELLAATIAMLNSAAPEWETESGIAEYAEAVSKSRSAIASAKGGSQ